MVENPADSPQAATVTALAGAAVCVPPAATLECSLYPHGAVLFFPEREPWAAVMVVAAVADHFAHLVQVAVVEVLQDLADLVEIIAVAAKIELCRPVAQNSA